MIGGDGSDSESEFDEAAPGSFDEVPGAAGGLRVPLDDERVEIWLRAAIGDRADAVLVEEKAWDLLKRDTEKDEEKTVNRRYVQWAVFFSLPASHRPVEVNRDFNESSEGDPAASEALSVLIRNETRRRVIAELQRLPREQRIAIRLKDCEELPVKEIARLLDCSPKKVEGLLKKARKFLRNRLAGHE